MSGRVDKQTALATGAIYLDVVPLTPLAPCLLRVSSYTKCGV